MRRTVVPDKKADEADSECRGIEPEENARRVRVLVVDGQDAPRSEIEPFESRFRLLFGNNLMLKLLLKLQLKAVVDATRQRLRCIYRLVYGDNHVEFLCAHRNVPVTTNDEIDRG